MNSTDMLGLIRDLLLWIEKKNVTLDQTVNGLSSLSSLRNTEIEAAVRLARRFGFLDESDGIFSITEHGKEFFRFHTMDDSKIESLDDVNIVDESSISITLPPFCNPLPLPIKNEINFTSETMKRVIADSEKIIYVATPFLSNEILQSYFENVIKKPKATIYILTSEKKLQEFRTSSKGNLILEELGKLLKSRFKRGFVFFLEKDMSISHAKILCSDRSLFVTSANIKKDSITENFELGIYTERKDLIKTVSELLDFLLDSGRTKCIYDTDIGAIL